MDLTSWRFAAGCALGAALLGFVTIVVVQVWMQDDGVDDWFVPVYVALLVAAGVSAVLGMARRGWARLPLLAAVGVVGLGVWSRLDTGGINPIDLTPFFLPPALWVLGLVALLLRGIEVSPTAREKAEHRR